MKAPSIAPPPTKFGPRLGQAKPAVAARTWPVPAAPPAVTPGWAPAAARPVSAGTAVAQCAAAVHVTMAGRNSRKTVLRRAKRQILAINNNRGQNASAAQIGIHDRALHAGHHHGVRVVTIGSLVDDITDEIDNLSALNQADNDNLHGA
jgi:hypothetical protein